MKELCTCEQDAIFMDKKNLHPCLSMLIKKK